MARLNNKVAIVTGGGSGFGAAIATRFASEGAKVIVADINTAGGESVAAQNPENIIFQKVDVTSPSDWAAVVKTAVTKFGKLDILVNNAGTSYRNKVRQLSIFFGVMAHNVQPTLEVTEAEWERVFNVNVKSIFHGSQAAIARLIEQGHGGSIINISSTGASRPRPGLVWYNASKGAVSNVCPLAPISQSE
ncbi:uncharacterized protein DSM5745_00373 [Aspergillus mulundensis]|uniref:Uncharacterized protein n=1 Tax=Aspergillus mulundensis TaxID=1810919 RepID=A0A3D8T3M3_9EURO|nr:hypothetical protein DSM5745_00373 [Aspergillus mulundensis]RDW93051.1 hypothetical protein DSM5745_00373 [Aspergillus mulundensis]